MRNGRLFGRAVWNWDPRLLARRYSAERRKANTSFFSRGKTRVERLEWWTLTGPSTRQVRLRRRKVSKISQWILGGNLLFLISPRIKRLIEVFSRDDEANGLVCKISEDTRSAILSYASRKIKSFFFFFFFKCAGLHLRANNDSVTWTAWLLTSCAELFLCRKKEPLLKQESVIGPCQILNRDAPIPILVSVTILGSSTLLILVKYVLTQRPVVYVFVWQFCPICICTAT